MEYHIYNLEKDTIDELDQHLSVNLCIKPQSHSITFIDHRNTCPEIFHQGNIGSCSSNAVCAVFYHNLVYFNYKDVFVPSRLFLYYNIRAMKHSIEHDNGGSLRDALKALNAHGVCSEDIWKYDEGNVKKKPPYSAYIFAQYHNAITYARVQQSLIQLKQCLIDGYLFVFGLSIYSSFEDDDVAKTGKVKMPTSTDNYLGGHAVCAVGFDDIEKVFIVRNSWGSDWGDKGYFYLPYDYILKPELVYDIWTFSNRPGDVLDLEKEHCIMKYPTSCVKRKICCAMKTMFSIFKKKKNRLI